MNELAEDIATDKRHTALLYVGDYDPSGMYMSEIDIPARLRNYGADDDDYELNRVAHTHTDVEFGSLPSFQAEDKKLDPRYRWFAKASTVRELGSWTPWIPTS